MTDRRGEPFGAAPFELDPRLAADTHPLGDLPLSRVLLMNDARYPWVVLVPRRPAIRELYELAASDRSLLLAESCRVAQCLEKCFAPHKLNLGALGNLVPQFHLHHIARFTHDPAWPGPVWGHSPAVAYAPHLLARRLSELKVCLALHA